MLWVNTIYAAHSKLENFAPKISLCAGLAVLSVRNANIRYVRNRKGVCFGVYFIGSGHLFGTNWTIRHMNRTVCLSKKK